MRVLVTGGNGELGGRVVPRLLAAGHDVAVGTRTPQPRVDGAREVAYTFEASTAAVAALLRDVEVVVHLATDPRRPAGDVVAMQRLVQAAEVVGLDHLLYVSIVGVDDHRFPYYRAKRRAEEALRGSTPQRSTLGWTILRTTQFHSLPGVFASRLGVGPVGIAPRNLPFQPLDPEVVAERVAELVDAGPSGRVADLGGPEVLDMAAAMRRWLRATGRRRLLVAMPLPARLGGEEFRRGDILAPGSEAGGRRFDEYLDEVAAARGRRQPIDGVTAAVAFAGWAFLATAVWMAVAPQGFVAGIAAFGEVADHFVRDLATFTAPLAIALILAASRPSWRRPVLALAMLQNGLHLVNHLVDIGTTDPAWHGPVNAVLLAALQVVLVVAFRATRSEPAAPEQPTADIEVPV